MRYWTALLLTVAATLSACTGPDPAPDASPAERPPASEASNGSPRQHLGCERPSRVRVEGVPVVPEGAVAARLCGGLVDNGGFNMTWPADTLHGRSVTELVDTLNRLRPYDQPSVCTLVGGAGFDLVLAYPDGSRVWLDGDTSGTCANIAVRGGDIWDGAGQILHRTLAFIEADRRATGARDPGPDRGCPRSWQDVAYTDGAEPVRRRTAVTVTACRYHLDRPDPGTITQSSDGRLTRMVRVAHPEPLVRMALRGSRRDPCHGVAYDLGRTQDVLLVRDGYGDTQLVSTTPCWAHQLSGQRRYPGAPLGERVAALLS